MNNLIDVLEYMHALGLLRMPRDCVAAVVVSCVFLCTLFMKFLTITFLLSFMIELLFIQGYLDHVRISNYCHLERNNYNQHTFLRNTLI